MQVFGLPAHIIRSARRASRLLDAETSNIAAARRRDVLARWHGARRAGLTAEQAARAVGVPRATLFRWAKAPVPKSRRPHRMRPKNWSPALRMEAERLRLDRPLWGKEKLGPILRGQGFSVSNATVGRIIQSLIARGRVPRVGDLIRKVARRTQPKKRPHAIRKPSDVTFQKPGDVIQIDTVSVTLSPKLSIKHFDAYDVHPKWTVAKPYRNATASKAADFLDKVTAEMPWPIKAIQIDGGSEFMAEFEEACAAKAIPLYVLPPRSPKLNGAVERCNGAWRYEFYAVVDLPDDIHKIAEHVDSFQHLYNHFRPHGALDGMTPNQYLQTCRAKVSPPSHMC